MNLFQLASRGIDLDALPDESAPERVPLAFEPTPAGSKFAVPQELDAAFQAAGDEYGVDPDVLRAMAFAESRFRPDVISGQVKSRTGAAGLMQFMPGTAERFGINPLDPVESIFGAAAYMRANLERFNGDYGKAVAAYNWGENRKAYDAEDWQALAPKETQGYLKTVFGAADELKLRAPAPASDAGTAVALPSGVAASTAGAGRGSVSPGMVNTKIPRAAVPDMTFGGVAQDVASGLLQVGPTAVKGVGEVIRLATGDRLGKGVTDFAERGIQATQDMVGSERAAAQRKNFAADMADDSVGLGTALANNKGALADQILPTIGSMFIPVGAAGAAGKLATVGKAARGLNTAALAARVASVQQAAGIGATAAQNAASTFAEMLDKGVPMQEAYTAAGITVPFSLIAGKLTGGGAEGALIKGMSGQNIARGVGEVGKGLLREGAQEGGESLGQVTGEVLGANQDVSLQSGAKRVGTEALLGAVMGGGMNAAQQIVPTVESQPTTPTAPVVPQVPPSPAPPTNRTAAEAADVASQILQAEQSINPTVLAAELDALRARSAPDFTQQSATPQAQPGSVPVTGGLAAELQALRARSSPQEVANAPQRAPSVTQQQTKATSAQAADVAGVNAPVPAADLSGAGVAATQATGVDIPTTQGVPANVPQPAQPGTQASQAQSTQGTTTGARVVLQNRDRSTPSSIAQMRSIAARPDYGRLGFSRDFANGAPVVAGGMIQPAQLGRQDVATASDGRRIPVQYAVVDAGSVLTSNTVDGTSNPSYGDSSIPAVRAIAGNGRIAGLQSAYQSGNANAYRQELVQDASLHGIAPEVIAPMAQPVLVRVMPTEAVTADIGDISNTVGNLDLSAVEQASNDANRVTLDALQFAEDGSITPEVVRQFVRAMPQAEQGQLLDTNGQPTRQAVDRLGAAVFAKAYGNEGLTRLYSQAQDPEARLVMSALAQVAPKMARLEGAGALDIRDVVAQAAEIAVNARRQGVPLARAAQQLDIAADPAVSVVLDLFAANSRSVRPVVEALARAADAAYTEATKPAEDMFGTVPRASRADIINQLRPENERRSQEALEDAAGREPAPVDAVRQANEPAGSAAPAEAQAGRPAEDAAPEGLTSYTAEEVTQRQAEAAQAEATAKRAEDAAARAEAAARQAKEIAQRSVAAADTFELGQSGEDNLSGQSGLMFSRSAAAEVRNLVTLHNLSDENLRFADSMGGIPVPSIGITKVDSPFGGFGNITLIAPKGMIDPKAGVPVYDRDAWTARFPAFNFKKVKAKAADAMYERMKPVRDMSDDGGQFLSMLWEKIRNDSVQSPDKVMGLFGSYTAPKMMYIKEVLGKDIKLPMRKVRASTPSGHDKILAAYWKKNREAYRTAENEMSGAAFSQSPEYLGMQQAVIDSIERYAADKAEGDDKLKSYFVETFTKKMMPDGAIRPSTIDRLVEDFATIGKMEVDDIKLGEAVSKLVKRDDPGYLRWAEGLVKPLFEEPTITLRGREVAPTLDNIVAAMTVGATAGAEKSMVFSPGKVAAMLGKQFKSLDEIKAARDQVVSAKVEGEGKKATDALLTEYRTHVSQFYGGKDWRGNIDTWAANDASMEALAKAGKLPPSDANIRAMLARMDFKGVDQRAIDLARDSITALRNAATDYFEAKPQRAVTLDEFKGAVVPKGTSAETLAILEKHGIAVEVHNKTEGAREKAIQKLAKRLDRQSGDVLYSRNRGSSTATTATIRNAIAKAYGNLLQRLESKGLVSLTQTDEDAIAAAAQARADKNGGDVEVIKASLRKSVLASLSPMKSVDANVRRGLKSLAKALDEKTTVHRAMFRNGLGWVDFVWGSEGTVKPSGKTKGAMGISHILEVRQRKDGMTEPEVIALLEGIVSTIASGKQLRRNETGGVERVVVEGNGIEATLVKSSGSNAWLLSGWEVKNPDELSAANVATEPTLVEPTTSRFNKGAGFADIMGFNGLDVKRSADGNLEGFFDPETGKSYLIADNLTAESAPGTLMHEVGIHMAADGKLQPLFDRAAQLLKVGRGNAFIQRVQARMDRSGETSGEEAAAYIVTEYENDRANSPPSVAKWVQDFTAAVRAWLFGKGVLLKADQLTVADIAAVARANARSMARGDGQGGVQLSQRLRGLWERYADSGNAFRFGNTDGQRSTDIAEVARAFSGDGVELTGKVGDGGMVVVSLANDPSRFMNLYTFPPGNTWKVNAQEARALRAGAGSDGNAGQRMYQALFAYAHNNDLKIKADFGLSPVNALRRTTSMLSSGLRFGSLQHLTEAHELQGVEGYDPENFSGSIQALADAELAMVTQRIPDLSSLSINPENGDVYVDQSSGRVANALLRGNQGESMDTGSAFQQSGRFGAENSPGDGAAMGRYDDAASQGDARLRDRTAQGNGLRQAGDGQSRSEALSADEKSAATDSELARYLASTRGGFDAHGVGVSTLKRALITRDHAGTQVPGLLYSKAGNNPPPIPTSAQNNLFTPSQPWELPEATRTDWLIYELQDGRIDLKRVQEAIAATGKQITEGFDARLAETLLPGRIARRTEAFLSAEVKPLLESMAKNNVSQDELSDYLLARHAPERNAQIAKVNDEMPDGGAGTNSQGVLMTTQAARDHIAALTQGKRLVLELLAKRVDDLTLGTREVLVREGLEKQETVDAWTGAYKHYVPLFKDEAMETPGHPIGAGVSVTGTASKRATGSTGEVTNMLAHILMQREAAITRAEKNRVAMSLYGLALTNPNSEMWTTIRPSMPSDQIADELVRMGVDPMEAEVGMQGVPTIRGVDPVSGKVVDRPNPMYKRLENSLVVKVNGEDRVILFNASNERAARLVRNLKNQDGVLGQLDLAGSIVGKATRYFASINTQYNPAFGMVNIVRDVGGAMVNLTDTALAGKQARVLSDSIPAMIGIARDLRGDAQRTPWSDLWTQFQDDGGRTGYRDLFIDPYKRADAVQSELDKLGKDGKLTPGAAAHAVLDLLDDFNTTLENGVRLSAYKAALDKGMSRAESARLARELTLDFNRKGRAGREMGPLFAFFNASVQGTARTLKALQGPAGKRILIGGLSLGVIQALLLSMAGYEDDEIPEFVKARAFIIPLAGKQYITIPLQFGLNALPNTGRVVTELLMSGGKDWGEKSFNALGELAGSFNPLGGGNIFTGAGALKTISPTVIDPIVDMATNTDFTGKPIGKERMPWDTRPGFTMGREGTQRSFTGQAYIGISKAINSLTGGNDFAQGLASPAPEEVRYVFTTVGGGVFRELEKILNASVLTAQGEDLKAREVPLGSRFAGEVDDDDLQRSRFFKNSSKIEKLEAQLKGLSKEGRGDEVRKLIDDNPLVKLYELNDEVRSNVTKLNKLASESINDKDALKRIDEARTTYMRALNDKVLEMEKAGSE